MVTWHVPGAGGVEAAGHRIQVSKVTIILTDNISYC